jgi:hypothetical protein
MSRALYHLSYGTATRVGILARGCDARLELPLLDPSLGECDALSLVQVASKNRGAEQTRLRLEIKVAELGFEPRTFGL